jgi:3''-phosphoadenosine 5''-phosphosulfate sulfotransferase (PAPS reductase)/FAD synthetase and related enzymes
VTEARSADRVPTISTEDVLDALEAEALWIMRETAGAFRKPVLMYSIGKDSSVLLHLARKAFWPAPIPFPLLHVDSTWEFGEMISHRDRIVAEYGAERDRRQE